jgi:phage shock protein C
MASFCSGCGASLAEGARFCSACGKAVYAEGASAGRLFAGRLTRPLAGKKIAGVCQGLALHFGWDVTLIRVIAVLLAVLVFPLGLIAYLILWVIMPQEVRLLPATTHFDTA